jgi:hypothetical protein
MPPGRTVNDLDVEPGRYEVQLDTTKRTFWLVGDETYHFPAALRGTSGPVSHPVVRLVPAGGDVLMIDADIPPDQNWHSYKRDAPI